MLAQHTITGQKSSHRLYKTSDAYLPYSKMVLCQGPRAWMVKLFFSVFTYFWQKNEANFWRRIFLVFNYIWQENAAKIPQVPGAPRNSNWPCRTSSYLLKMEKQFSKLEWRMISCAVREHRIEAYSIGRKRLLMRPVSSGHLFGDRSATLTVWIVRYGHFFLPGLSIVLLEF